MIQRLSPCWVHSLQIVLILGFQVLLAENYFELAQPRTNELQLNHFSNPKFESRSYETSIDLPVLEFTTTTLLISPHFHHQVTKFYSQSGIKINPSLFLFTNRSQWVFLKYQQTSPNNPGEKWILSLLSNPNFGLEIQVNSRFSEFQEIFQLFKFQFFNHRRSSITILNDKHLGWGSSTNWVRSWFASHFTYFPNTSTLQIGIIVNYKSLSIQLQRTHHSQTMVQHQLTLNWNLY